MEAKLPRNFNLERHIQDNPVEKYFPKEINLDHAKFLLAQITEAPALNDELENEMNVGFVPLSSDILQDKVPNYKMYWDYFEATNVVEINHKYRPKTFFPKDPACKSYRFTKKYRGELISVAYSPKFEKGLIDSQRKKLEAVWKEYWHLIKWLMPGLNKLQIDHSKAMGYLKLRRKAQYKNPDLQDVKKKAGRRKKKRPKDQYRHAAFSVWAIGRRESRCKIDDVAGRMHTVLTNIKGDLRNIITYDGQPLVSIDITNSQPYFASLLIDPKFYERKGRVSLKRGIGSQEGHKEERRIRVTDIKEETGAKLTHNTLMSLFGRLHPDSEFVKLYKMVVSDSGFTLPGFEKADFYNFVLAESALRSAKYAFATRSEVKLGMFEVFFSKIKPRTKAKRLFASIFPEMAILFEWIKDGPGDDDYKRLACLLQNIESVAILKVVTKRLAARYPEMPMYTIHDSIVVPARYQNEVKQFMADSLEKLVGLRPKLTIDEWKPSNLDEKLAEFEKSLSR